jgi:translation initiation factor IF-2
MKGKKQATLQDLFARMKEGETRALNLIVKGDVQGSVEALKGALNNISVEGAKVQILHSGVGAISESDITAAIAYDAIVMGFNVRPDAKARRAAESTGVEVRTYRVIYELLDEVKKAMVGLLEPTFEERHQGAVEVRQVFHIPKVGTVAGCFVVDGAIARNHHARLTRDGVIVWEGRLASLRRFKNDVREVSKGFECGLGLQDFQDIKPGDEIETYIVETVTAQA